MLPATSTSTSAQRVEAATFRTRLGRGRMSVATAAVRRKQSRGVVASHTLVVKEGHKDQAVELCMGLTDAYSAVLEDKSEGMIAYECTIDRQEENVLHLWERYENADAMRHSYETPRYSDWIAAVRPHLEEPVGVSAFSYEDGAIGPTAMLVGPKGEGGLDDASGASKMAGGAGYKQTSSAMDLTTTSDFVKEKQERVFGLDLDSVPWMKNLGQALGIGK